MPRPDRVFGGVHTVQTTVQLDAENPFGKLDCNSEGFAPTGVGWVVVVGGNPIGGVVFAVMRLEGAIYRGKDRPDISFVWNWRIAY